MILDGSDLDILVPVLWRPHRVLPLLDNILGATPQAHVLFIADSDDEDELIALGKAEAEYITLPPTAASYAKKINAGFTATSRPFVFTAADDLDFNADWYLYAREKIDTRTFVVGTNDRCNYRVMQGTHSTHTLVKRSYITKYGGVVDEPPGKIFHEGYPHEYCDDEFIQTAQHRGVFKSAHSAVVRHMHPLTDPALGDATYDKGREFTAEGRELFKSRKHLWGPSQPGIRI